MCMLCFPKWRPGVDCNIWELSPILSNRLCLKAKESSLKTFAWCYLTLENRKINYPTSNVSFNSIIRTSNQNDLLHPKKETVTSVNLDIALT